MPKVQYQPPLKIDSFLPIIINLGTVDGVSKIEAYGEVYGLEHPRDFPGAHAQACFGFVLGTASTGELWLQHEKRVVTHLKAKREGLMLSLGGGAVATQMNQ